MHNTIVEKIYISNDALIWSHMFIYYNIILTKTLRCKALFAKQKSKTSSRGWAYFCGIVQSCHCGVSLWSLLFHANSSQCPPLRLRSTAYVCLRGKGEGTRFTWSNGRAVIGSKKIAWYNFRLQLDDKVEGWAAFTLFSRIGWGERSGSSGLVPNNANVLKNMNSDNLYPPSPSYATLSAFMHINQFKLYFFLRRCCNMLKIPL